MTPQYRQLVYYQSIITISLICNGTSFRQTAQYTKKLASDEPFAARMPVVLSVLICYRVTSLVKDPFTR